MSGQEALIDPCAQKLVPVVSLTEAAVAARRALPLGQCLRDAGLKVAEITLRNSAALRGLEAIADVKGLWVGAGTVLDVGQAREAVGAGAKFLVSPGLDETIIDYARDAGIELIPGVATASELMQARRLGVKRVKFFPAEVLGGAKALRALCSVFGDLEFMPTGGVTTHNLREYLTIEQVVACGGSWLTPADKVMAEDWQGITSLVKFALGLANGEVSEEES